MSFKFTPGNKVEVPELNYKGSIDLSASESALVIVDMQNDFIKENGTLVVPAAKDTILNIQNLRKQFKDAGSQIVYTQDTHYEGDKEWEIWPEHCRKDTWGWQIIDELKPDLDDMVFQKNRYDGFYGTSLDHYLAHVWNIKNLVITGTVSNICVAQTAASAGLRWFNIVVPADCISAQTEFDQALTLRQVSFLYAGEITKSFSDINSK